MMEHTYPAFLSARRGIILTAPPLSSNALLFGKEREGPEAIIITNFRY